MSRLAIVGNPYFSNAPLLEQLIKRLRKDVAFTELVVGCHGEQLNLCVREVARRLGLRYYRVDTDDVFKYDFLDITIDVMERADYVINLADGDELTLHFLTQAQLAGKPVLNCIV